MVHRSAAAGSGLCPSCGSSARRAVSGSRGAMHFLRSLALRDGHRELIAQAQGNVFFGHGAPRGLVEDLSGPLRRRTKGSPGGGEHRPELPGAAAVPVRHEVLDSPNSGRPCRISRLRNEMRSASAALKGVLPYKKNETEWRRFRFSSVCPLVNERNSMGICRSGFLA
jgi:hypothetical protein